MNPVFENITPVKDNSDQVMQFLKFIEKDVSRSHELASIGIHTELAQSISGFISNPLLALGKTYITVAENLKDIFKLIVEQFLKANSGYIEKVYYTNCGFLEYYIILKKDTTKHRNVFFEFLRQYELLDINHSLPIHFSFLPKKAKDSMDADSEVALT